MTFSPVCVSSKPTPTIVREFTANNTHTKDVSQQEKNVLTAVMNMLEVLHMDINSLEKSKNTNVKNNFVQAKQTGKNNDSGNNVHVNTALISGHASTSSVINTHSRAQSRSLFHTHTHP